MKNREVIYSSLEVIEQNLKSDMTVYSLSQHFGFSIYYFTRLFSGITGYTPKNYILGRKITQAARELVTSRKKIIDIALDYGFSSPESFSRAFHKITGMTPSRFREEGGVADCSFVPLVNRESLERETFLKEREPQLVTRGEILLAGLPFYYDISRKNDLSEPWENLTGHIHMINNLVKPHRFYQLQYWFEDQDPGSLFFYIAIEVSSIEELPIQFTAKIIPPQRYLRFNHKGVCNTVGQTYEFIYNTYLPDTDFRLPHMYNFEYYGENFMGPYNPESISEIYIPIHDE